MTGFILILTNYPSELIVINSFDSSKLRFDYNAEVQLNQWSRSFQNSGYIPEKSVTLTYSEYNPPDWFYKYCGPLPKTVDELRSDRLGPKIKF